MSNSLNTEKGSVVRKQIYTEQQKEAAISRYNNGETVISIAKDFHTSRSTIYYWIKKSQERTIHVANNTVSVADYKKLQKKLRRQQLMIEILQVAHCSPKAPLSEKLRALAPLYGKYPVHVMCEAFNISRGTYYNHIFRNKRENTKYKAHREELKAAIIDLFYKHNQTLGSKRITGELKEAGFHTTKEMVFELMKEMGLFCIRSKSKRLYNKERQDERKRNNLINRDFCPLQPNQVWAGDTTMIEVKMKKYFLCTVMDLFSRKILAYGISYSENTHLIKSTFEKAVKSRSPQKGLVFHSDQGRAYTSNTFVNYLKELGVQQSFSKKGTPYDNSVAESFNATLKEEELYRYHYHSEREFRQSVDNYLDYYNNDRPHTTLKYMCPCEYEKIHAS